MKKNFCILFITFLFLLVFGLCICTSYAEQAYTFKIAHVHTSETAQHKALESFAKYVKENTNNDVIIEIYPDGSLGSGIQVIERTMTGIIDGALGYSGGLYPYEKSIGVFSAFFLWDNYDIMLEVWKSEIGKKINEGLSQSGFVVLGPIVYAGERYLATRDKAVYSPDDLKGLKIRTVEDRIASEFTEAMGCIATPIAFNELYMALQQKVVDGDLNGLPQIWEQNFFEQEKYLMLTNTKFTDFVLIINADKFNALPKAYQEIMERGAYDVWAEEVRQKALEEEKELIIKLQKDKGMIVTIPNREAFKEIAFEKAYELESENIWPQGLFDEVLNQIEIIKKSKQE